MRLWRHMRSLWPRYTLLPVAPFIIWTMFWAVRGQLRWDHIAVCLIAIATAYGGKTAKRLYFSVLPLGLVGLLYDAMRFVANVGLSESTVHVCDLRAIELSLFGITSAGVRQTIHDWAQHHARPALDLFFAVPYGIFIFAVLGFAIFLFRNQLPSGLAVHVGLLFPKCARFCHLSYLPCRSALVFPQVWLHRRFARTCKPWCQPVARR